MRTKTCLPLIFVFLLALTLCACQPIPASSPTAASPSSSPVSPLPPASWWRDTVFYEIFVRSFYDSDGNGVGDLPGLIDKLDYLNDGKPRLRCGRLHPR